MVKEYHTQVHHIIPVTGPGSKAFFTAVCPLSLAHSPSLAYTESLYRITLYIQVKLQKCSIYKNLYTL